MRRQVRGIKYLGNYKSRQWKSLPKFSHHDDDVLSVFRAADRRYARGVTVGENTIVGARSVLMKDLAANVLVGASAPSDKAPMIGIRRTTMLKRDDEVRGLLSSLFSSAVEAAALLNHGIVHPNHYSDERS